MNHHWTISSSPVNDSTKWDRSRTATNLLGQKIAAGDTVYIPYGYDPRTGHVLSCFDFGSWVGRMDCIQQFAPNWMLFKDKDTARAWGVMMENIHWDLDLHSWHLYNQVEKLDDVAKEHRPDPVHEVAV